MNSTVSKVWGFFHLFRLLHNKSLAVPSRSAHFQAVEPCASDLISSISNLLRNGGKWESLSSKFGSAQLEDNIVERILLNLKEPVDAKSALLFFHWSSHCWKHQHCLKSHSIVIHILVRANLLADARVLIESVITKNSDHGDSKYLVVDALLSTYELAVPDPRVFDLLLQAYSRMRMVEQAFDACRYLADHGLTSSLVSLNKMLLVAQRSDRSDLVWRVYEHMFERRVYPNQTSVETMVNLMCKEGSLLRNISLMEKIHGNRCAPGVLVNMTMILRIFEDERFEQGIVFLRRMLQKNLILDDISSSLVIFAFCRTGRLEEATKAYDDMVSRGCRPNVFVHTCLIGAYCKEGRIEEALHLVEEMQLTGLKAYNETYDHLIEGCARAGRIEESVSFCEKMMRQGLIPAFSAFSEVVGKLCELGQVEKADEIYTVLLERGFAPNEEIYCKLINGYGTIGKAEKIKSIYYEMQHRGFVSCFVVYASLVINLSKCGKLMDAEKFLSMMEDKCWSPTKSVYNALISSYLKMGDTGRAMHLSKEMLRKKIM
ncbi:Pentatricopeptide repeat-containing protein [Apostasia shenzhenica]|uniref:Pentatricopeptide repeat-containing protein n=1 Tax=Apostasia shenzhenica TaxID=1088818 RepID=A0A2I0AHY5_9ASPA|nr:Pentatricopeptide repeat-containing protein [Apostasia shenzhenica]